MPESINKRPLTKKEHDHWRAVFKATGSGAQATAAVKKSRAKKKK